MAEPSGGGPTPASPPPAGPPPHPHASPSASSGDDLADELEAELGRATPGSPAIERGHGGGDGGLPVAATKKRGRDDGGGDVGPSRPASLCPPHPGSMGGICVRCGAAVPQEEVEGSVALRYIHGGLRLHADEAARVREAATSASTAGRRLHLVLDLDHTLLNSTRLDEVPPALRPALDAMFRAEAEAIARAVAEEEGGEAGGAKEEEEKKEQAGAPATPAPAAAAAPPAAPAAPPAAPSVPTDPRRRQQVSTNGAAATLAGAAASTTSAPVDPRRCVAGASAAAAVATLPASLTLPPAPTDPRRRPAGWPAPPPPPPPLPPPQAHRLQTLFSLPGIGLITKLRPGLRAFLAAAHERYELVVYTHGDRAYANVMARLLDPDGTLFGGRVISQNDSTVAHAKSLDVVLGQATATLILDDTAGVWPDHAANLIQVDRYIYFPACAGRFGAAHPSLLEAGRDEVASLNTLAAVGRVLAVVHDRVFKGADAADADAPPASAAAAAAPTTTATTTKDIRVHLAAVRANVLAGCILVLSGCAPIGTDPAASPVGRAAVSLGARLEPAVAPGATTHVIAAVDGTAKAAAGRKAGAAVVGPDWVYSALFLWRRADEARFPPPPAAVPGGGGDHGRSPGPAALARRTVAQDVAAAAAAAGGGRLGGGGGGRGGGDEGDDGDGAHLHIEGVL